MSYVSIFRVSLDLQQTESITPETWFPISVSKTQVIPPHTPHPSINLLDSVASCPSLSEPPAFLFIIFLDSSARLDTLRFVVSSLSHSFWSVIYIFLNNAQSEAINANREKGCRSIRVGIQFSVSVKQFKRMNMYQHRTIIRPANCTRKAKEGRPKVDFYGINAPLGWWARSSSRPVKGATDCSAWLSIALARSSSAVWSWLASSSSCPLQM